MNANDVLKYLCELLNINTQSTLVIMDITEDLKSIEDLNSFRLFAKANANSEKYKFLTGYQKFLELVSDFKKQHNKLNDMQLEKVLNFSDLLFKKATTIFDDMNWTLQIDGKNISDVKTYYIYFEEKENKVLQMIGTKDEVFNMATRSKEAFRGRIEQVVHNLSLSKTKQLTGNSKSNKVLELIKKEMR